MAYSVLIIGAGNIGAFFDTPQSPLVLTHAHAYSRHPGFTLTGFVDADYSRSQQAAAVWGGEAFLSVEEAFRHNDIDLAVIAAPDDCHYSLLKQLAEFSLKLVVAEKPITKTIGEANEIINLYRDKGISLAINYTRRYVPEFNSLRERIRAGEYGDYLTGSGYYGKGTLHNGSHMVDLLRFLLGEITDAQPLNQVYDFYPDDPSCSISLRLDSGAPFFMQAIDCRCYTIFELDLLFARQRIRLTDAGVRIESHEPCDNKIFAGYRNLAPAHIQQTRMDDALIAAATNFHDHLSTGAPLLCSGLDGYKAIAVPFTVLGALQ
jgi:predicted dehydrogenase